MAKKPSLNDAVNQILTLAKTEHRVGGMKIRLDEEIQRELQRERDPKEKETLEKSIVKLLNQQGEAERLAFEVDPNEHKYASVYKQKIRLIPDKLLKRIAIQDDLVASIVQARQNHLAAFGRPRPDRFSTGFVIEPKQETLEKIEKLELKEKKEKKAELQKRIAEVTKRVLTCGDASLDLKGNQDRLTFPQYISMSVRNAIVVGRIATEVLWKPGMGGGEEFAGFRVIDAGTIYRTEPQSNAAAEVRKQARALLARLKDEKINPDRFEKDDYPWIQVIDNRPVQAFTAKECLVHNFYAVPDVELDGYPVTPLDTVMAAVTTHINITTHNKLYFQSGRAARGMLIIKSDEVDETVVARIRQQFNAQINSTSNAWRMPCFGIGLEDDIQWQPIDNSSRDMEFQYLSDMNARVILSAFQMSPEELPGWSYLSRGTNSQALSEGNNEYKLQAARDVGLRPLLAQFEDFINTSVFPLFDKDLAKLCTFKFVGLDAETAEKESVRLAQDAPLHMTYDEILEKVQKRAIGKKLGGELPFNPQFQAILDKYVPVGQVLEHFFGIEGASKDPQWAYVRDPFWFQNVQMQQQAQQMQQQQQMAQQQQAQGGGDPSQGGDPNAPQGGGEAPQGGDQGQPQGEAAKPDRETVQTEKQKTQTQEQSSAGAEDLTRSIDQAIHLLNKSEAQLPSSKRRLLLQQKMLVADFVRGWEHDLREANKEIMEIASVLAPKPKS